ncbi:Hsp33 family molecular chaperone HslO [Hankyongella ginsenosidimutans]|uniref:Hsp33 family molecular chaperone HslO n=1 Tax=Hankyongella ginsenosidimutans TaxID=1763828 RepID=UPI001CA3412A|nr:Hsp33 family molecular chaperone HslO [Hankyongella ginsenosidimutans]
MTAEELTDPSVGFDVLLWRLFHQERVLVHEPFPLTKGCRCSIERIQAVLRQFSFEDLMEMREPDGSFRVNCAFCSRDWIIERPEPNDR